MKLSAVCASFAVLIGRFTVARRYKDVFFSDLLRELVTAAGAGALPEELRPAS